MWRYDWPTIAFVCSTLSFSCFAVHGFDGQQHNKKGWNPICAGNEPIHVIRATTPPNRISRSRRLLLFLTALFQRSQNEIFKFFAPMIPFLSYPRNKTKREVSESCDEGGAHRTFLAKLTSDMWLVNDWGFSSSPFFRTCFFFGPFRRRRVRDHSSPFAALIQFKLGSWLPVGRVAQAKNFGNGERAK